MLSIEYMSVMVICPTGRANDGIIYANLVKSDLYLHLKPFREEK